MTNEQASNALADLAAKGLLRRTWDAETNDWRFSRPARTTGGPQLSAREPEEAGPPKTVAELLSDAKANRIRRKGAQLVDTLRVNQQAADVLNHAYTLAGGERVGAFDGARGGVCG